MTDEHHTELSALRAELARVTKERDRFEQAIRDQAIDEVNAELDRGEDCPNTWTLAIGGVFVEVDCNAEHRATTSAKILPVADDVPR
jgi:chaperonin cofactor prefoldin